MIAGMSIVVVTLGIDNARLKSRYADLTLESQKIEHKLTMKVYALGVEAEVVRHANALASERAQKDKKVVEKKVVEIKNVYVPQIEYIDRYVGDSNETDCENADGLLRGVVY